MERILYVVKGKEEEEEKNQNFPFIRRHFFCNMVHDTEEILCVHCLTEMKFKIMHFKKNDKKII